VWGEISECLFASSIHTKGYSSSKGDVNSALIKKRSEKKREKDKLKKKRREKRKKEKLKKEGEKMNDAKKRG
jgi:hypothetical protein